MPLSNEEFERIKKLWAEAYLKLNEMGQIIGKHTKKLEEKMGMGGIGLTAIIQRKDGSTRKTQEYKFQAKKNEKGKPIMVLENREIKEFPKEVNGDGSS